MSEVIKNCETSHPALLVLVNFSFCILKIKIKFHNYTLIILDTFLSSNIDFKAFIENFKYSFQKYLANVAFFADSDLE